MYALGEKMFWYRAAAPHDFACATCHGDDAKRIRLQDLPNLTTREGAQKAYTTWPAYRVSQGELRTMQWRLYDCFRQQRFPELGLRFRRRDRADDVPRAQRQRRRVRRARRSSAEERHAHAHAIMRDGSAAAAAARRLRQPHRRDQQVSDRAARSPEGVVQGARPGGARTARPGRDAAAVQRARRQGAAEGRGREDRGRQPRDHQAIRPTASSPATGRAASASRRRAAASSSATTPPVRSAPIATPAISCRAPSSPTAPSVRRSTSSASCAAYDRRDDGATRTGARCTTRRPSRLLQHAALRAQGHPQRAADQGRGRAADGPAIARQPVM